MSNPQNNSEFQQELGDSVPRQDLTALEFWLIDGDATPWKSVAVNCLAILALPLVLGLSFGMIAGIGAFMGAFPGTMGARRTGVLYTAPFVLLAIIAGYFTLHHEAWAPAIGAALAMVAGLAGRRGVSMPAIIAMVTWTIYTGSILPVEKDLVIAAAQVGGLAWSLAIIKLFGGGGDHTDSKPSRAYALIFGALFAVGIAFSTWVGQNLLGGHGFWFPLCLAILSLPPHTRYFTRAAKRVIGTALGCGLAYIVGSLALPPMLVAAIAVTAFVFTQRYIPKTQIFGSASITLAIILIVSEHSPLKQLAVARLVDFAAGAGLAALLAACGVALLYVSDKEALRALQQR
ncbi:FUSC family protein [Aurantiacibacter rhizosphaerae]|uniref:Integral membrane bound transporter domain-containing protein n=1 Tax=Aurantiacibacter rhizosphaerae TaxID=2691582 RepID=A0A844XH17_9SPHN|nr:FUSC family protein [Aurantiacibacter rhizosphaerae]MWV29130.1 hypothetical protein [Aurantiacibacter rhizosphaerae]